MSQMFPNDDPAQYKNSRNKLFPLLKGGLRDWLEPNEATLTRKWKNLVHLRPAKSSLCDLKAKLMEHLLKASDAFKQSLSLRGPSKRGLLASKQKRPSNPQRERVAEGAGTTCNPEQLQACRRNLQTERIAERVSAICKRNDCSVK